MVKLIIALVSVACVSATVSIALPDEDPVIPVYASPVATLSPSPSPSSVATPVENPVVADDRPVQIKDLEEGEVVARLTIERLGMNAYPIRFGITEAVLALGPGLFPGSAAPGDGNFSMAGHRVTPVGPWSYGPFRYVDKLQEGDIAEVLYEGETYIFEFVRNIIVDPSDVTVLNDWRADMTFTACNPPGSATTRIITQWELVTSA